MIPLLRHSALLLTFLHVLSFCTAVPAEYVQCPGTTLDPIITKGKKFFDAATGDYFPIKGIAYYPRPNNGTLSVSNSVDFFTDEYRNLWESDIMNFKALGLNTIRIYAVDPSKNHDAFMCQLQAAGIHVIVGLLADCENCGIGPDAAPSCYPPSLKMRGQFIINEFSKYSNTLAFSAGNEVTFYATDQRSELNAPCQKKFLRDMREYVNTCSSIPASTLPRKIPIGLVNWDRERDLQTRYYTCRTDPADVLEDAEWFGLNTYQHCDVTAESIDQLEGWIALREYFANLNLAIPVVISEYGCREPFPTIGEFEAQRTWLQVDALYSPSYVNQFAGGVVFEYSAEKRMVDTSVQGQPWPYYGFMKLQYGVGYYSPVDCDHLDIPCQYNRYPEFSLLAEKLKSISASNFDDINTYIPTGTVPRCPIGLAPLSDFVWDDVDNEPGLPCYVLPTRSPTLQPSIQPSDQPTQSYSPSTSPQVQMEAATSPESSAQPTAPSIPRAQVWLASLLVSLLCAKPIAVFF